MARIIYSGLVTAIRGSIGGTTFQSNAYGFTVKNKANMVKPNSAEQNIRKIILSKVTKAWGTLSVSDRNNWNTFASIVPQYAKHNPSSVLSGFAAFTKWHCQFYQNQALSNSVNTDPNTSPPTIDTGVFSITSAAGVMTAHTVFSPGSGDWMVNLSLSRPFNTAQNFIGTSPRNMAGDDTSTSSYNVTTKYTEVFGRIAAIGEKVALQYTLFDAAGGIVVASAQIIVTVT
jgi:hypothetical protein